MSNDLYIDVHIKHKLDEDQIHNLAEYVDGILIERYNYSEYDNMELAVNIVEDEEFLNSLNIEIADWLYCKLMDSLLYPNQYFDTLDFTNLKCFKNAFDLIKQNCPIDLDKEKELHDNITDAINLLHKNGYDVTKL